jgi:hypothetical protein
MPVTAAAGEVYKVKLIATLEDQEHLNILGFAARSAIDDVQLRLLKALVDCFLLNMIPGLSSKFTLNGATGHQVYPALGPEVEYFPTDTSIAHTGLATGDGLPSYSSCVTSIHTTRGGRSGRGRMFIGGVPEGSTTFSTLNVEGAFWVALLAYIACVTEKFIHSGDPGANEWQLGVISRKLGGTTEPISAAGFAPATSLVPHRLLATTRSRKIGHGS